MGICPVECVESTVISGEHSVIVFQFIRIYKGLIRRISFLVVRKVIIPSLFKPWLSKHRLENGPYKVMYCHGGCIVQTQSYVYKVAFRNRSEIQEEARISALVTQSRPELAALLISSEYYSTRYFACIAMPRCEVVGLRESVDYGIAIYNRMKAPDLNGKRQLPRQSARDMEAGLNIVSQMCQVKNFEYLSLLIDEYLAQERYSVGVVHGDFHSRNILLDTQGAPKLIDLDCLKLEGIQELDAVHFIVEYVWSRTGQNWLTSLEQLVSGKGEPDLLRLLEMFGLVDDVGMYVAYMLNRLGLERRMYGTSYAADVVKPALGSIFSRKRIV